MKMSRLALIPAALLCGPALAHVTDAVHLHETDAVSMVLGLALIGAGIGAAVLVRVRGR